MVSSKGVSGLEVGILLNIGWNRHGFDWALELCIQRRIVEMFEILGRYLAIFFDA